MKYSSTTTTAKWLSPTPRIQWIDFTRGLCALMVVIVHTVFRDAGGGYYVLQLMGHVCIPTYFILSGYLYREGREFLPFLKRKAKALLVPYFTTGLLCILVWLIVNSFVPQDLSIAEYLSSTVRAFLVGSGIWLKGFSNWPIGPLWFLPCLFLSETIFFWVRKIPETTSFPFSIPVVLGLSYLGYRMSIRTALPWSLDLALYALVYLEIGYTLKRYKLLENKWIIYSLPVWTILFAFCPKYPLDLNSRIMSPYLIELLLTSAGCITLILLSKCYCETKLLKSFISYLGENSLVIFIWHNLTYSGFFYFVHYIELGIGEVGYILQKLCFSIVLCEVFRIIPILAKAYNLVKRKQRRTLPVEKTGL